MGTCYEGLFPLEKNLDTLRCRIGTLIILAGQVFDSIGRFVFNEIQRLGSGLYLRLRQHKACSIGKLSIGKPTLRHNVE